MPYPSLPSSVEKRYSRLLDEFAQRIGQELGIDEVFEEDEIRKFIKRNASGWFTPDELFTYEELREWAAGNGFIFR